MSRTCTICTHTEKEDINRSLLDGEPFRHLAERTGTSTTALQRHKADHLPVTLSQAVKANEIALGGSLLEQLNGLQAKALGILTKAEQAGDLRTALMAVREVRGTLELVGKVTGELVSRHKVSGTFGHLIMPGKSLEELEDRARRLDALLAGVVEGTGVVVEDGG